MKPLNEGNPSESESLAAEVQRGFDDTGKMPARLQRYSFARERALINLSEIERFTKEHVTNTNVICSPVTNEQITCSQFEPFIRKLEKIRPRIAQCGDYLSFKDYYTVGKVRLTAANFCMVHLLCPLCAIRRGSKTLEAYVQRFEIIKSENPSFKLSMLTLTIKNGDDLGERFNHLKKSVSTVLEHRRKALKGQRGYRTEFAKIAGLVGSIEITKDGGKGEVKETGWHPHAHIMVLHEARFDYKELQAEWLKITGDSHVLNVAASQHPDDPAQDFLEVFKYALKFSDLTPAQNLEAFEVINGKNLLFSAGLFRGVEIPESQLDEELDELPYIELLYRYLPGSGYNLEVYKDSEVCKPGRQNGNVPEKSKNTRNNRSDIAKFLQRTSLKA